MAYSVSRAIERIRHTLGGDPKISAVQIINDAGRELVNMHSWRFLERPSAGINTVATQSWVSLPSDFGRLIDLRQPNGNGTIFLTSLAHVNELRALGITTTGTAAYHAAISYQAASTSGAPTPVLELYPTPGTSVTDAFTLMYAAGWQEVTGDADFNSATANFISIPYHVETLYGQLLEAFARGYHEEDQATLDERLSGIMQGGVFYNAKRADGRQQRWYGQTRNSYAQGASLPNYVPANDVTSYS